MENGTDPAQDDPSLEPIWGAEAMAPVIKRTVRQTFYLLETGQLPARKVGGRWVSTAKKLRAALVDWEDA